MPRTLYILCRLPFAGKTTLARQSQRQLGFERVSIDEINGERDDDFAHVVDHCEPPADDEHVLRYDGSETVAGWITHAFS